MTEFEITLPELKIEKRILAENVHWKCMEGEFWCIMGGNGSGKTTLLQTLAGLNKNHLNNIHINQQPLSKLPHREKAKLIGILLQDQPSNMHNNILEAVSAARYPHLTRLQKDSHQSLQKLLEKLDLLALANRQVKTLSGGEQQRLHIAMLLAQDPKILLLDEPTNHLDFKHQHEILQLLKEITTKEKKLTIIVLHDINLAAQFADRFCFIYPNKEVEIGSKQELLTEEKLSRLLQCKIQALPIADNKHFYFNHM